MTADLGDSASGAADPPDDGTAEGDSGLTKPGTPEPAAPGVLSVRDFDLARIPLGVRLTAAWTWRLLLIAAGIVVVGYLFKRFEDVLFPVALAILLSAFLLGPVEWAVRKGVPRALAVLLAIFLTIAALLALVGFVIQQAISGGPDLVQQFLHTIDQTREWLATGPLHIDSDMIRAGMNELTGWVKAHEGKLASSAIGTAAFGGKIGTGILLTVFLMIFFLYDGRNMWTTFTKVVPKSSREWVRGAGSAGFGTLESYVRATIVVAAIDATCIGVGLAILNVPMVLPLVAVIFLGSFIPIVGSFVAGSLAVIVALTTQGWIHAVIVLCLLVLVMAVEGHVLQPFLLGYSVKLHPVVVILAIAVGIMLAGIVGGLLAVPLVAFLVTAFRWRPGQVPPPHKESKLTAWLRRTFSRNRIVHAPAPAGDTTMDSAAPST